MKALVLAGLSVRMMVEAAARDGYAPIALDVFGDLDTRRAASRWQAIGSPESLRIEPAHFLAALARLRQRRELLGWVAGSGFENQPELLERGAALLPLIGMAPGAVRELRDPRRFFGALDALRIPHPPVRFRAPAEPAGWLRKRSDAAGGWHIASAADPADLPLDAPCYWQRRVEGRPMSALFVANGAQARIIGFNELTVRPIELAGRVHPFVYCGAIGPVTLASFTVARIDALLQALSSRFGLLGLGSLDFLLEGSEPRVLEINPRPSASMTLHAAALPDGLMRAHEQACRLRRLPEAPRAAAEVRGHEILFARTFLTLGAGASAALARRAPTIHDLPPPGSRFIPGSPLCSVSASGRDMREVRASLAQQGKAVLDFLENDHERRPARPPLPC